MTRARWLLLFVVGVSVVSAFFLRDAVYSVVVVPIAYTVWVLWIYYSAVPQLILWAVFLLILFVTVVSNFIPEARGSKRPAKARRSSPGEVETLAAWFFKAQRGNYFKWQIANRLGGINRELNQSFGRRGRPEVQNEAVEKYFDAGLNKSFVDFPLAKNQFYRASTPLDLNPKDAVDYLESQMAGQEPATLENYGG